MNTRLILVGVGVAGVIAVLYVHDRRASGATEATATSSPPRRVAEVTLPRPRETPPPTPELSPTEDMQVERPRVPPPSCEGEECVPVNAPPTPRMMPGTGDSIARVVATRTEIHKLAARCSHPHEGHLSLRYIAKIDGGHGTISHVDQIASDVDTKLAACLVAAVRDARWTADGPDGEIPIADDMLMSEL